VTTSRNNLQSVSWAQTVPCLTEHKLWVLQAYKSKQLRKLIWRKKWCGGSMICCQETSADTLYTPPPPPPPKGIFTPLQHAVSLPTATNTRTLYAKSTPMADGQYKWSPTIKTALSKPVDSVSLLATPRRYFIFLLASLPLRTPLSRSPPHHDASLRALKQPLHGNYLIRPPYSQFQKHRITVTWPRHIT
jgi:hypothetical protein